MGEGERGREELCDEHLSGRSLLDQTDTQILHVFVKSAFESAQLIAQTLNTSPSVVQHHLHEGLGFKSFHLRWVPHFLTDDLRLKRKHVA
jgi:hypothetical protein